MVMPAMRTQPRSRHQEQGEGPALKQVLEVDVVSWL